MNIRGHTMNPSNVPILHGFQLSPPNPDAPNNPDPGIFRWHYLQCVIRKLGTDEYKNLPNIAHYELPHRTEDDEDDEYEFDPDIIYYPSQAFDRMRWLESEEADHEDRMLAVSNWIRQVVS
jgi:hypothetical protein